MYKQHPRFENVIIKTDEGKYIPKEESNRDYQEYLKWLDGYELVNLEWVKTSNGNTPEPADE
jgi:hypothetical protein